MGSKGIVLASVIVVALVGFAGFQRYGSTGGSSGDAASNAFAVQTSQLFVTVENRSGLTLSDIRVAIVPVGRATLFTSSIGRMDPGEKRDISIANFRGREGTPFNLRVHRPISVEVTATDINQKQYKTEVDWQ